MKDEIREEWGPREDESITAFHERMAHRFRAAMFRVTEDPSEEHKSEAAAAMADEVDAFVLKKFEEQIKGTP